jgi:hypothetical protein
MPAFEYHEAVPPPALADVVLSFWGFFTTDECPDVATHTVWPDACASIMVGIVPGAPPVVRVLGGRAEARTTSVRRGSRFVGLRFWPDAGGAVLGVRAGDIADGPLPQPFSESAERLAAPIAAARDATAVWDVLGAWSLEHIRVRLRHLELSAARADGGRGEGTTGAGSTSGGAARRPGGAGERAFRTGSAGRDGLSHDGSGGAQHVWQLAG